MKWCRRLIEVSRETVLEGVETNHCGRMCQDHGVWTATGLYYA